MNMCKNAMRAAKTLLLVGALSLAFKGDSVQAETYMPSEDSPYSLVYEVTEEGIVITGYEGDDYGKLEIPGQIGGVTVVEIGVGAFTGSDFSGELVIPDGVTKIGGGAFSSCEYLKGELVIPGSVTKIDVGAFQFDSQFDALVLSEGIKRIESSAFSDCGFEGDLVIPDSVEYIGDYAFSSVKFDGKIVIPDNVEYLGNWVFWRGSCKNLMLSFNENITFKDEPFFGLDFEEVCFLYKPNGLNLFLDKLGYFTLPIYYPTYVDGWEEAIAEYPDYTFVAYEPSVVPFIQRMYQVALDRTADEGGLKSWVGELLSGNKTGAEVAFNFIFSNEFKEKNYCDEHYIMQLYKAFMGREYDEGGLNHWSGMMKAGTTREAVFNGFSQSDEFKGICENYGIELGAPIDEPLNGTVPTGPCVIDGKENGVVSFIKRLYKICLDRDADENGLSYWSGMLRRNECSGATAAHGFVFSEEFINKNHSDADYIEYLYQAFMGRASEPNGKAYWLERMASGEVTREDVFNGFAYSAEFVEICNGYGITAY